MLSDIMLGWRGPVRWMSSRVGIEQIINKGLQVVPMIFQADRFRMLVQPHLAYSDTSLMQISWLVRPPTTLGRSKLPPWGNACHAMEYSRECSEYCPGSSDIILKRLPVGRFLRGRSATLHKELGSAVYRHWSGQSREQHSFCYKLEEGPPTHVLSWVPTGDMLRTALDP